MRIAQIGQFPINPDLIKGGVESSVYGLAKTLSISNDVFVFDNPRIGGADVIEVCEGMIVFRFCNNESRNLGMKKRIPDIVRLVKENAIDICHIHGTSPFSYRMFCAIRKVGIPTMVTVHGLIQIEKRKLLKLHFSIKAFLQYIIQSSAEKRLLSTCEHAIVDTEYVASAIRSYGLKTFPYLHVIPQGIRQVFFKTQCSQDSFNILSVGAFSRRKGHLLLIKAFERVLRTIPQAHLDICGIVSEKDYYDELMMYLSSSPCRERVSIRLDYTLEQLVPLFAAAHVFALHSQEESQGIVLAEAMAVGLPVVSTKVGGIPYVVLDGETGLLSEYGDVDSFSKHLITLLMNPMVWYEMSQRSHVVSKGYEWGCIAKKVEDLYQSFLIR